MIRTSNTLLLVALSIFAIGWLSSGQLFADSCCASGSKTKTPSHDSHRSHQPTYQATPEPSFHPPHGGQVSKTTWNHFEVVYGPHETRIYVYDMFRMPTAAHGIQGQAFMRVRSNGTEWRYPLEYVPVERGQDYLVVRVNLTQVQDGDMDVHFELAGMPNRDAPTARFANLFARPPAPNGNHFVTRLPLNNGGFARPVANAVRRGTPQVTVTQATVADDAAIRTQGTCPVTSQPLGAHGAPIKVAIDGRTVFVCCQGCVGTVQQDPGLYSSKAVRGQQPNDYARKDDWFYQKPAKDVGASGGSWCSSKSGSSCH